MIHTIPIAMQLAALFLVLGGVALIVYTFLSARLPDFEVRGRRAGNRIRALRSGVLLPILLPLIHFFTAYALLVRTDRMRARLELWLRQADEPIGLVPSEVLGLCALCSVMLGLTAAFVVTPLAGIPACLLGLYAPYDHFRGAAQGRIRSVSRSVPTMADLIVLSMESGLDFIGSVRLLIAKTVVADGKMPIRDELLMVLNQLHMGRTRRDALLGFAERVPTEAVRTFVTSIVHAEEKGMSLRDVLRIQAEVLRHKRVQEAEAYISAANVQMLAPIMIVVLALMAVILVPMVTSMGSVLNSGGAAP